MIKEEFLNVYCNEICKKYNFESSCCFGYIDDKKIWILSGNLVETYKHYMACIVNEKNPETYFYNTLEELLENFEIDGEKFIDLLYKLKDFKPQSCIN